MAVRLMLSLLVAFVIIGEAYAQVVEEPLALPECQSKCGNIIIPYPFGIGANCSGNSDFIITCNTSYTPPKPFLENITLEVMGISIDRRTIHISNPSIKSETPPRFIFSDNQTRFTTVLDWSSNWTCSSTTSLALCGKHAECYRGRCYCRSGYAGNAYTPHGCRDIDECSSSTSVFNIPQAYYYNGSYRGYNYCSQGCNNEPGSFSCYCFAGFRSSGGYLCYPDNKKKIAAIGTCSGIGGLILLFLTWRLYKLLIRRKERKLKEKFFKKNGGLLLQQQISSSKEGHVEKCKLFTSKELDKATDHYNEDRILGQGGQGTVYKGMLTDGRIVAVKKSKIEDESELEPFINEVVILSKIDHRNIVKLHGCCLETEVPLLIYEFIPNGTLFQYIHEQNDDFPLIWDVRVRVAKEIAGALFYLHSAASLPIYHRDIKSTNILLDEKFRAKVADFGTSRSTDIDQTHFTTRVQGTFGYLDPEYFQSSQFTDKSDVYSFGVVLVELLTGQKPILSGRLEDDGRSLATFFILAMEQDRLFDILDPQVMEESRKEEVLRFAKLAHACLNLNGRKRPTMKQVSMELERFTPSTGSNIYPQHYEEVEFSAAELVGPWEFSSTSLEFSTTESTSLYVEEPLLHASS